jgi:glycosyltransferase involved in cell wall biosynthesis
LRVLQCPKNIAGQAWEYSQSLRVQDIKSDVLTFVKASFNYKDDLCLNLDKYKHGRYIKLINNLMKCVRNYDVFHFHYGETLLPNNADLPFLKMLKKKMVMNYWGDDIRQQEIALSKNKYHKLIGYEDRDKLAIEKIKKIASYMDVAIVPAHETYEFVVNHFKRVEIIPIVIDIDAIKSLTKSFSENNPLIVHSPSDRKVKGTEYILNAISKLQKKHKFRFQLIENMPNTDVKQLFSSCDIVVDQLLIGNYGTVSLEAMAAGKPALCYIRDDLTKYMPYMPIVNTNIDNIYENLEMLITNPSMRSEIGKRGYEYVEQNHNPKIAARQLISLYESI